MKSLKERLLGVEVREEDRGEILSIIEDNGCDPSRIIAILQDLQSSRGYLPEPSLRVISRELGLPLTRVYGLATFYRSFRLIPRGRHEIRLCTGTACHVRGAERIKDEIQRELGVEEGGTTEDYRFSFETVRCIGCCSLAPVMTVDGDVHGKLAPSSVEKILEKYR